MNSLQETQFAHDLAFAVGAIRKAVGAFLKRQVLSSRAPRTCKARGMKVIFMVPYFMPGTQYASSEADNLTNT